jgi:glycogen debranching enzyme
MMKMRISKTKLQKLHDNALKTLNYLVSKQGIYASSNAGWSGPFYAWFGRDSAVVTDLLCEATKYGGDRELAIRALSSLLNLATWQGTKDDPATGEEHGKIPHEIRTTFDDIHTIKYAKGTNEQPWFIDPADGILKNWDSADSTALWVMTVIRAHRVLGLEYNKITIQRLSRALKWILRNLEQFDGLVGFVGADLQPERVFSGLHNQGWKDSLHVYQNSAGELSPHPIKDVLVNAEAWAASSLGSREFQKYDTVLADQLRAAAGQLKERFNDQKTGFLLSDKKYFAQAIDGQDRQLRQIAADPAVCLWAYDGARCAISREYIAPVVKRIMSRCMFNPLAGIRNYAISTTFHHGTRYHGGANVYWPFVSGLVARGLYHYGYDKEARRVTRPYLNAVGTLGSNIEMFIGFKNHKLTFWKHPEASQQSAVEQAWTAAAVYYGTYFIEKRNGKKN